MSRFEGAIHRLPSWSWLGCFATEIQGRIGWGEKGTWNRALRGVERHAGKLCPSSSSPITVVPFISLTKWVLVPQTTTRTTRAQNQRADQCNSNSSNPISSLSRPAQHIFLLYSIPFQTRIHLSFPFSHLLWKTEILHPEEGPLLLWPRDPTPSAKMTLS